MKTGIVAFAIILAGCAAPSATVQRHLAVSGSLPKLAAITPQCLFLCFVSATIVDHVAGDDDAAIELHHHGEAQLKGQGEYKPLLPNGVKQ
jgi:hypothetical protein